MRRGNRSQTHGAIRCAVLASAAVAVTAGCGTTRRDSFYAARPAADLPAPNFNEAANRLAGLLEECGEAQAGNRPPDLVPVDPGRIEEGLVSRLFEPLSLVTVPGAFFLSCLRWTAFEDADSLIAGSRYASYIRYDAPRRRRELARAVTDLREDLHEENLAMGDDAIDSERAELAGGSAMDELTKAYEEDREAAAKAGDARTVKPPTSQDVAPSASAANPATKDDDELRIHPDDEIEIYVESLLTDKFTEGRWRDSLGGNGEELALQVSLNGLTASGALAKDDVQFLIEKSVQLHDPVLTLLQGNERGARLVAKYNDIAKEALEHVTKGGVYVKKVTDWIESIESDTTLDTSTPDGRARALSALRQRLEDELQTHLPESLSPERRTAVLEAAAWITEKILSWAERRLASSSGDFKKLREYADQEVQKMLGAASEFVAWASKYSIDEKGLVETMKAVQGLAAADRLTTLSFSGIRPGLLLDAISNVPRAVDADPRAPTYGGTAARLLMRKDDSNNYVTAAGAVIDGRNVSAAPGLIYRGRLRDVATTGDAQGISLSVLLLELDSDEMVKVLRYAQAFVAEGATIGGGSSEIAVSSVLDAATIVAERIAQNDVELKCIDLRFIPQRPDGEGRTGTPGQLVFDLRPCRVVVGRNLDGMEFGAVAVVRVRKVPEVRDAKPTTDAPLPVSVSRQP